MITLLLIYFILGPSSLLVFIVINLPLTFFLHKNISKYLRQNDDLERDFPAFVRKEKSISRKRIFFGLVSFVYLKLFLTILFFIILYVLSRLLFDKKENSKVKHKRLFDCIATFISRSILFIMGIISYKSLYDKERVEGIYKKYLGESFNYNAEINSNAYSTVIANHSGWLDSLFLYNLTRGDFLAKASISKIPIIGELSQYNHNFLINRDDSSKENKLLAIKTIEDKQISILNNSKLSKLVIFPEGTGSNNTCLIDFKKGAFASLTPVKPYLILFHNIGFLGKDSQTDEFSLAPGGTNAFIHVLLCFCYLYFNDVRVMFLPVIKPTEYLYEKYQSLGKSKTEIYMNACRLIMGEVGELKIINGQNYEMKKKYMSLVKRREIRST